MAQSSSAGGWSSPCKGIGKRSARQYIGALNTKGRLRAVADQCRKYAAFGGVPYGERCGYLQAIFDGFDGMRAEAPSATVAAGRSRGAQLAGGRNSTRECVRPPLQN